MEDAFKEAGYRGSLAGSVPQGGGVQTTEDSSCVVGQTQPSVGAIWGGNCPKAD